MGSIKSHAVIYMFTTGSLINNQGKQTTNSTIPTTQTEFQSGIYIATKEYWEMILITPAIHTASLRLPMTKFHCQHAH